ncbi:MAG: tetratricopeptide repeat protein [Nitrospira sp.]|nr:tetratricopeptide repeat protein [bacterium]MBL7049653.1 tetratricopeptide repeat protein [Nitrospira sp.]
MQLTKKLYLLLLLFLIYSCSGLSIKPDARSSFEDGLALFNLGQYEEAVPHFQKAAELDPDFSKPYFYLGRSYLNLGRWLDAIQPLRTAYDLSPEEYKQEIFNVFIDALIGAAKSEFAKGNLPEALSHITEAYQTAPGDGQTGDKLLNTLFSFGTELLRDGKFRDAITAYSAAADIAPDNAASLIGLARAFIGNGDVINALKALNSAIKLSSGTTEASSLLQQILLGR